VTNRFLLYALLSSSVAVAPPLAAQCQLSWGGTSPLPGSNGTIADIVDWDPDGVGPQPPVVVFAGTFTSIANIQANNVAIFDPQTGTFSALGSGVTGPVGYEVVSAVAVHQGMLVVGGRVQTAGGNPVTAIARWNGSSWSGLGSGLGFGGGTPGIVYDLVLDGAGNLVAGGVFSSAGGTGATNVASWNGTSWSAMGIELTGGSVRALHLGPAGAVVAGGDFISNVRYVAQWNGANWVQLGPINATGPVVALATTPGGALAAAGSFGFAGVMTFTGTTWVGLGGLSAPIVDLEVANGEILASAYSGVQGGIARWTGFVWVPIGGSGTTGGVLHNSAAAGSMLFATSDLRQGAFLSETLEQRTGTAVTPLIAGATNGPVLASTLDANGNLVVGGDFTMLEGVAVNRIARRSGTTWSALGTGLDGSVLALLTLPNGDIIAGGTFTQAGGATASRIARFNGTSWSAVSNGRNGTVRVLAASNVSGTEFFLGGDFTGFIARHFTATGAGFGTMTPVLNGPVYAIEPLATGDVVAGGAFTAGGSTTLNHIGRLAFGAWSPLANGTNGPVKTIRALPNGDLVVGGAFSSATIVAEKIARWNGTAWSPLGSGMSPSGTSSYGPAVEAITLLPNGDLLAGGDFTGAGGASGTANLARWNGTSWSAVASSGSLGDARTVEFPYTFTMSADGSLFVGGGFTAIGSQGVGCFARLQTSCLAAGQSFGAGCSGAAGPVAIQTISRPWIGSMYRSRTTGIPFGAVAFAVVGLNPFAPPVPLSAFLPQALPGCNALAQPDTSVLLSHVSGVAENSIPIALDPSLIGASVFEQTVILEMNGSNVTAATSSNGLQVTVGSF
jgi:hypothetical protein